LTIICNLNQLLFLKLAKIFVGYFGENFIRTRFYLNRNGNLIIFEHPSHSHQIDYINSFWDDNKLYNCLHKLFVKFLDTEQRLITYKTIQRTGDNLSHHIYKLWRSEQHAKIVSTYFNQAFGLDLKINRDEFLEIPLHIGKELTKNDYTIDVFNTNFLLRYKKMPRLDTQGDGMRSFTSILLDTFTSEYTVTLIDEPEAFLHPPQARLLGKILATHNPDNR
jgi:predicted ATPase